MESVLLLVNSAPSSVNAQRAWQLARTLCEQGKSGKQQPSQVSQLTPKATRYIIRLVIDPGL